MYPLAYCNKCGEFYIDTNPKNNQQLFSVKEGVLELIRTEDEDGSCIGCPECHTDAMLIDFENQLALIQEYEEFEKRIMSQPIHW